MYYETGENENLPLLIKPIEMREPWEAMDCIRKALRKLQLLKNWGHFERIEDGKVFAEFNIVDNSL